jgi:hypothetical protein
MKIEGIPVVSTVEENAWEYIGTEAPGANARRHGCEVLR